MVKALCSEGETVHLFCQERTPEKYDFIAEAFHYHPDLTADILLKRDVPYAGRCILHIPQLGDVLPVYVGRFLQSSPPMLPMNELSDEKIHDYVDRNYRIIREIVRRQRVRVLHVNHAVLMSLVAERIHNEQSIPYAVMPHGSELEYVIRNDVRFLNMAAQPLSHAGRIFVLSAELRDRVIQMFSMVPEIRSRMFQLQLGVDTTLFEVASCAERRVRIKNLLNTTASIPGGKQPQMTNAIFTDLDENISFEKLKELMELSRKYAGRQPDRDLQQKLSRIDWEKDSIILYCGRLISGKGIQLLIAALPLIFESNAHARLVIAGHGPLREGLEVLVWALKNRKTELLRKVIHWGSGLEGGEAKSFAEIRIFFDRLQKEGKLDHYFETARNLLTTDRVVFTGYLKHQELRYLFSSSDVAVFPSIVPEAGPLVFLEAMASGCFPLATYVAGAAGHIDVAARYLPPEHASLMKIRPEGEFMVSDIVDHVSAVLSLQDRYRHALRKIAVDNYDWTTIARQWKRELHALC